jgi:signal transduction histidine kinase
MTLRRLAWRIGFPFAFVVLAGSVGLVMLMAWHLAGEERSRFENLARTNADFIDRTNLPASERLAEDLQQVIGSRVLFRRGEQLTPAPPPELDRLRNRAELPADRRARVVGDLEIVAVPLAADHDLVLARPAAAAWRTAWQLHTFAVLGAFWLLALLVAWLLAQGLVRPLRHLATQLPEIEKPGPLALPEAERADEIGDVARAFLRTRAFLQSEREQRERAEKLAMLGRMTASLAHEIQNPVSAIKMHAQLWQGEGSIPTLQVIEREAERIECLLNQWLFLVRPQPPAMNPVDVAELVARVVQAHQTQLDHAEVRVVLAVEDLPRVQGDAKRLSQVFRNLLVNAVQAMPRGGQLTIAGTRSDAGVEIGFADTGRGFSTEALVRFAEFFFSEREGGMGIGLGVASEIVKAHGGELRAANLPAGGACMTVALPRLHVASPGGSH